nr:unnamed protein product [Digitaria exilis]
MAKTKVREKDCTVPLGEGREERVSLDVGVLVCELKETFPGDDGRAIKGEVVTGTGGEAREGIGLVSGDTEAGEVDEAKTEEEEGYKEGRHHGKKMVMSGL